MRILQVGGKAKEFLCDVIMAEVLHIGTSREVKRNSLPSALKETHLHLILHNGTPPPCAQHTRTHSHSHTHTLTHSHTHTHTHTHTDTHTHTHTHTHTPVTENENLIFRGNIFATKAVDTYMKMVGETVSRFPILG